ncbi:hypothetical protein Trydic_g10183 [Trypoxylus dichotomus]
MFVGIFLDDCEEGIEIMKKPQLTHVINKSVRAEHGPPSLEMAVYADASVCFASLESVRFFFGGLLFISGCLSLVVARTLVINREMVNYGDVVAFVVVSKKNRDSHNLRTLIYKNGRL